MMNKKWLVRTTFAKQVKEALDNGDLNPWFADKWVTKYNGGHYDKLLHEEVKFLISYFEGKRK